MAVALTSEQAERFDARVGDLAENAFSLLEQLVACESTVGNENAAQEVVAEALAASGFDVSELAVPQSIGEHRLAGVPQRSYEGRFDVVGRRNGNDPVLLFNGHIDVVPADRGSWSTDPFDPVRRDGWLFGRGAGDMKGGFAMVILALRALQSACPDALELPIGFVSVIEEECTGNGTLASLLAGVAGRVVVLPEPSDLGALLAGVGVLWADLELRGAGGHAHVANELLTPVGAIAKLIDAVDGLGKSWSAEVADEDLAGVAQAFTTNVGLIESGNWRSSVASSARLGVRVGFPRGLQPDDALRRVEEAVREAIAPKATGGVAPGANDSLGLLVEPTGFRAEGYRLDPAHELVELLASCHASVHDKPLRRFGLGSTTDARYYLNQVGVPSLCYGPTAVNIHGADEAVELQSIVDGARTIGRLVARIGELEAAGREPVNTLAEATLVEPGLSTR